jgi:MFS superfamily sulfate permease-like transporter
MSDEALNDLAVRTRQLEAHLLRSPEYLFKADQDLKRQVVILYLAIALLFLFQGFFVIREAHRMPDWLLALIIFTSVLAILNCALLIRTKRYLHRLNEGWLNPEAQKTLEALRREHEEMRSRASSTSETR